MWTTLGVAALTACAAVAYITCRVLAGELQRPQRRPTALAAAAGLLVLVTIQAAAAANAAWGT